MEKTATEILIEALMHYGLSKEDAEILLARFLEENAKDYLDIIEGNEEDYDTLPYDDEDLIS